MKKNNIKKIALLKDEKNYILLLLCNSKLGYIKSSETLNLDMNTLLRIYKITTYEKDVVKFLNIIYKTIDVMDHKERFIGDGKLSETIGDNVIIFHTSKAIDYSIKETTIEALINMNDFRQKELETTIVCEDLDNCITYHNGNRLIVLNNLPYEIIKVY